MVNKLAKSASTKSSRPIASNIEGGGVAFFKEVRSVLQAALTPDNVSRGEKLLSISALIESNQQETQITLEKQKRGKARSKQFGKVEIPQEAFIGVLKISKET